MKKIVIVLLCMSIAIGSFAQQLQGTLESWHTYQTGFPIPNKQLETPDGWYGIDSLAIWGGQLLLLPTFRTGKFQKQNFKTTDAHGGTYAAMLMTRKQDTLGVISAMMTNAQVTLGIDDLFTRSPAKPVSTGGGIPVTKQIASVNAWVKYAPRNNDTAVAFVQAVLVGKAANGKDSVVGVGGELIFATTNYSSLNVPIAYVNASVIPDRIVIGFASSYNKGKDSSTLYVDDVTMIESTGVAMQSAQEPNIICYPNPTNGIVHIVVNGKMDRQYDCNLLSASGQQVANKKLSANNDIDMTNLSAGIYFYNILDNNGQIVQCGKIGLVK